MSRVLLAGADLVSGAGIVPDGWLEITGGRISALGSGTPPQPADVDLGAGYLTPGFVDIHSHGGGSASVVGARPEAVARFAETHRRAGTTTIMASLVSARPDALARDVAGLADLAEQGLIVGTHLEGPWISPARRGAHEREALRDPDAAEIARLLELGRGTISMVTLAPELPHGLAAVRQFVDAGVVVAIGHTDATYDQTRAAIEAGATVSTHLYNAMRPVNHRDPGPVVALTQDERITNELILDGHHVDLRAAAFARRAAEGRIVIVSDALPAAGSGDSDFLLGGLAVHVVDGVARVVDGGALAGSTLTLRGMLRNAIEGVGMDLPAAIEAVTSTPARILGLADRGVLAVGARADLCHLTADFDVSAVWVRGARV